MVTDRVAGWPPSGSSGGFLTAKEINSKQQPLASDCVDRPELPSACVPSVMMGKMVMRSSRGTMREREKGDPIA